MKGYVMVGSSDLKESKAFYDVVLAVMGIVSIYEDEVCVGYAHKGNEDVEFYITKPANGEPVTYDRMIIRFGITYSRAPSPHGTRN